MPQFNIYHRKDGRWEGRISRGRRENGRRKYQYVFGKSREQVQSKMVEIKKISQAVSCEKSVETVISDWLNTTRVRVKESTFANYTMKVEKHIIPAFGSRIISQITEDDICKFIDNKKNEGLSIRYISDILIIIKSMFKYAVRLYHIFNPMDGITLEKKGNPDIRLLDSEEQKLLENYISENHTLTTMGIALTMTTGLRIGELCALQWKDIDLEKRILTVRKTMQRIQTHNSTAKTKLIITEPKSESSKRNIPITKKVAELLSSFQGQSDEYILTGGNNPIEPRTMQYRFAKILKNVNLPSVHFHALRHIFASTCIKLGFDVKALSELLGHSSVEITLNRYVHSSMDQKREYMERLQYNF